MGKYNKYYKLKFFLSLVAMSCVLSDVSYGLDQRAGHNLRIPLLTKDTRRSSEAERAFSKYFHPADSSLIVLHAPDNVYRYEKDEQECILFTEDDRERKELLNLPLKNLSPQLRREIEFYKIYYDGFIKDVRLYVDGNNFKVLLILNSDYDGKTKFIENSHRFNRNIIGHFSRLLKLIKEDLKKDNIGDAESRLLLERLPIVIYYTVMDYLSIDFPDIYRHLFRNSVYQTLNQTTEQRIPVEFQESYILKDILAKRSIFINEIEEIEKLAIARSEISSTVALDIYDMGAASGLFGAVISSALDKWAKDRKIILNATFYIVDIDIETFKRSGEDYYEECKNSKYKVSEGGYGLNFSYVIPGKDEEGEKLDNGYAQKVIFKEGAIVIANDFYEHVKKDIQDEIISHLARQGVDLHLIHVPYEPVPDPTWGHVQSFDHGKLKAVGDFFIKNLSPFESDRYVIEALDIDDAKTGFLVIRRQGMSH